MAIVLNDVASPNNTSVMNSNFQKIEDAINDDVLRREIDAGEANEMRTHLDMNSNKITNVTDGTNDQDAATYGQLTDVEDSAQASADAAAASATASAASASSSAGSASASQQSASAAAVAAAPNSLLAIARSLNVADTAVISSTDTVTVLDNVSYIYDATAQTTWGVPALDSTGKTIVSVVGSTLTTTGGTGGNSYTLSTINKSGIEFATIADIDNGDSIGGKVSLLIGDSVVALDYAAGNDAGVLFFTVVAAGTGTDDGGKYIDLPAHGLQLEQNLRKPYSTKAWGAKCNDSNDDYTATQNAIDYASTQDDYGTVSVEGISRISNTLDMPNRTALDLNHLGQIVMTSDNIPIIDFSVGAATKSRMVVSNGRLKYLNQQTAIGGSAVKLADSDTTTTRWRLENLSISKAYHSVYCPDGANVYLAAVVDVTSDDAYDYGFYFGAGASVHTNIKLDGLWAISTSALATTRAFHLANIQELSASRLAFDGLQTAAMIVQTCQGVIGTISAENNTRTSVSGGDTTFITFSSSKLSVGQILLTGNTIDVTGTYSGVYVDGTTSAVIDHITDNDSNVVAGTFYTFFAQNSGVRLYNKSATITGTTPSKGTNTTSTNTLDPVVEFDGKVNHTKLDTGTVIFKKAGSHPSVNSWTVGDVVVNTNPTELGSGGSKYIITQWTRLTTGSGNTTNVDWFEARVPTGN